MPYPSASAVVIHYEEALYQVYAPLPFTFTVNDNTVNSTKSNFRVFLYPPNFSDITPGWVRSDARRSHREELFWLHARDFFLQGRSLSDIKPTVSKH